MLNKQQKICWSDNVDFEIQDIECISYITDDATKAKRLEGMITVNYRPHTPMEQDILVGILLAMYMGNDIPEGEKGSGSRRTTRGHCRQDIPLGTYDRKHQRWTLKGNHTEVDSLMKLIRKGDDVSLSTLEKIRAAPWKARPPNIRQIIRR